MSAYDPMRHEWDRTREFPTTLDRIPDTAHGVHESVFRSYQILKEVKEMLDRGDSVETIREFIRWTESE